MRSYVYCRDDPADCADPSGLGGDPEQPQGGGPEVGAAVRGDGSGLEPTPLEAVQGTSVTADPTAEQPLAVSAASAEADSSPSDASTNELARLIQQVQDLVPQAQAEARRARQITGTNKVAAVDAEDRVTYCMQSLNTARKLGARFLVPDALAWAKSIGRRFLRSAKYDLYVPGDSYAGHAEPRMIAWQDQDLPDATLRGFAVSRAPCPESCRKVLGAATATGVTYVVAYPGGLSVYYPAGVVHTLEGG